MWFHHTTSCAPLRRRTALESGGVDRSIEVSLVVPAVLRNLMPMQELNPDNYLVYLSAKVTIDIHTYNKEPDEEGNYVEPDCLPLHEPPRNVKSVLGSPCSGPR